jgi:hypothetical protein
VILVAEHRSMAPIFGIFFAFWAVVLVVLWLGVGLLLKVRDRTLARRAKETGHGH